MQYFGVPTCPYCKKRVNLIRTWSLKKQGEFQCPRCGGISNIYLSPLIYVVALLSLFAGGAVYFFHKFVLDDISLDTALQVFLPFAIFFFLSIFFVYLAKPVIKKVSREEMERKKFGRKKADGRQAPAAPTGGVYFDQEDRLPQREYPTGPVQPAVGRQPQAAARQPYQAPQQPRPAASVRMERPAPAAEAQRPLSHRLDAAPPPRQAPQGTAAIRPPVPVNRRPAQQAPVRGPMPQAVQQPRQASRVEVADDFFAKYDDPAYIQRRLREMKGGTKQ